VTQARETTDHWGHRLRVGQFNALAGAGFMVPRFLVVVIAPTDADEYVRIDPDAMILSHAAYWLSLADRAELPADDGARTVAVRVPKRNLLTGDALAALVRGDLEGAGS